MPTRLRNILNIYLRRIYLNTTRKTCVLANTHANVINIFLEFIYHLLDKYLDLFGGHLNRTVNYCLTRFNYYCLIVDSKTKKFPAPINMTLFNNSRSNISKHHFYLLSYDPVQLNILLFIIVRRTGTLKYELLQSNLLTKSFAHKAYDLVVDDFASFVKSRGYFFLNESSRSQVNSEPSLTFQRALTNGIRLRFNHLTSRSIISTGSSTNFSLSSIRTPSSGRTNGSSE